MSPLSFDFCNELSNDFRFSRFCGFFLVFIGFFLDFVDFLFRAVDPGRSGPLAPTGPGAQNRYFSKGF